MTQKNVLIYTEGVPTNTGEIIIYREIPGMPGYAMGTDGSAWSKKRGGVWRRLKAKIDGHGYHWISPMVDNKYIHRKTSRLVLETFIGPKPENQIVRHLNDIHSYNRLSNLSYGTKADNAEDARRNGFLCIGEKHGMAKVTEDVVREIRRLRSLGHTYKHIQSATGVKVVTACAIATRRIWKHVE